MIAAARPAPESARLLVVDADGAIRHARRRDLATFLDPGDLVVANDAATLPASLGGIHARTGAPVEVRLAGWRSLGDPTRFTAVLFGAGDHRTPTEDRPPPPPVRAGDRLALRPLTAKVARVLGHPRLVELHFEGGRDAVLAAIARHGRPVQYAHVPEPLALWDVWTRVAATPAAFEPPSAGFALEWRTLKAWRARGVEFATLTHAAGLSSTGDAALDRLLPFDEHYRIPQETTAAIARARSNRRRIVAIGTTVVRALESAVDRDGCVRPGSGVATGRIGSESRLRVVDAMLTGVHEAGESHFELMRAFADGAVLDRMARSLAARGYRGHEFGDSVLLEKQRTIGAEAAVNGLEASPRAYSTTATIGP